MHPVFVNESTNEGNKAIIENILLNQWCYTREDPRWEETLAFFCGDWKTLERLNSLKQVGKEIATLPFDKLHHILPIPGLWHLKFNMLQMIHSIHMGDRRRDETSFQFACDKWNRTDASIGKKFRPLENLAIQSYGARIVALLFREAKQAGIVGKYATVIDKEEMSKWLNSLNERAYTQILGNILGHIHPSPEHITPVAETRDEKWANNHRLCQHVESYLLLRYAIKHADLKLLLVAIKDFAVMSQAPEAHKSKYALELLQTLHMTDGEAAHPSLQRAALANCLVNLRGKPDSWFPTDLLQELVNNAMRTQQKERTSSTLTVTDLIGQCSLNSQIMQKLKQQVEIIFSTSKSGRHPYRSDPMAVRMLAQELLPSVHRQPDYFDPRFTDHVAADLIVSGLEVLQAKITAYNTRATMTAKDYDENDSDIDLELSLDFPLDQDDIAAGTQQDSTVTNELAESGLEIDRSDSPTLSLYNMDMDIGA
jgi:hypothetical protein